MLEIIEVINGGSIYLLLLDTPHGIVEVPVDHRMMTHIVESEELDDPQDLRGRMVDLNDGSIVMAPADGDDA